MLDLSFQLHEAHFTLFRSHSASRQVGLLSRRSSLFLVGVHRRTNRRLGLNGGMSCSNEVLHLAAAMRFLQLRKRDWDDVGYGGYRWATLLSEHYLSHDVCYGGLGACQLWALSEGAP